MFVRIQVAARPVRIGIKGCAHVFLNVSEKNNVAAAAASKLFVRSLVCIGMLKLADVFQVV